MPNDERLSDAATATESTPATATPKNKRMSLDATNALYRKLGAKCSTPFKRLDKRTGRTFTVSAGELTGRVTKDSFERAAINGGFKASAPVEVDENFAIAEGAKETVSGKAGEAGSVVAGLHFMGAITDEQAQKRAAALEAGSAK